MSEDSVRWNILDVHPQSDLDSNIRTFTSQPVFFFFLLAVADTASVIEKHAIKSASILKCVIVFMFSCKFKCVKCMHGVRCRIVGKCTDHWPFSREMWKYLCIYKFQTNIRQLSPGQTQKLQHWLKICTPTPQKLLRACLLNKTKKLGSIKVLTWPKNH